LHAREGYDDLPAATLRTANVGRRSFWANIVMELCCYSNLSGVSAAQLDDSMQVVNCEHVGKQSWSWWI
jgi:hypothetical protein